MQRRSIAHCVFAPLALVAACSAQSVSPDSGADARADSANREDASPDTGPDAGPSGPCPAAIPAAMTACARELTVCQYGSDPRERCRPTATCSMGLWTVSTPTCAPITPTAQCPATREAASGQACAPLDAACAYDGLLCRCTNCRSFPLERCDGPLLWQCNAPNPSMGCPATQPNLGTACAPEGQRCDYDCETYGVMGGRQCQGGVWTASGNNCPISTRRAKRAIEYVRDDEREQLSRDVLRTRLATYEYTDPALAGRRRLGFVYEDESTHRYARDPDISGVDLYGYTSLLLATVQTQQRQIEQLQREVRALRGRR